MSSPFELLEAEMGGRLNLKETGEELHKMLVSAYRFFRNAHHTSLLSDPMFDTWFDLHIKNSRINDYQTVESEPIYPPKAKGEPVHFTKQREVRKLAEEKLADDQEYRELLSCVKQKEFDRFILKMVYYATLRYGVGWNKELRNQNNG